MPGSAVMSLQSAISKSVVLTSESRNVHSCAAREWIQHSGLSYVDSKYKVFLKLAAPLHKCLSILTLPFCAVRESAEAHL